MITKKTFIKKTRTGSVFKITREHCLREDIPCGISSCNQCPEDKFDKARLKDSGKSETKLVPEFHYLVVDTNVVLKQLDILEDEAIKNVIFPQTVMEEVKHRSSALYTRLKEVLSNTDKNFYHFTNEFHHKTYVERMPKESANDRNDRAIREVAKWFSSHVKPSIKIVLLTNDRLNKEAARKEGLLAFTCEEYVNSMEKHPLLMDKLAHIMSSEEQSVGNFIYPEHLGVVEIKRGVKAGKLFEGKFQTSRHNYLEGYVFLSGATEEDEEKQILIQGRLNINRAFNDDVVAIEILPKSEWSCPTELVMEEEIEKADTEEVTTEELTAAKLATSDNANKKPTAKVVGIVKRNWRAYCGILQRSTIKENIGHLFVPAERRIPKIRIITRQAERLASMKIVVVVDRWPRDSKYPRGHYVRCLGKIGDKETENEVLLLEHDIPYEPFSQAVLNCLPSPDWSITPKDEKERLDLRSLTICSVDPPGCTDIDDALHCYKLPNGNYNVGVHIADVSSFIRPGTAIDKEAEKRGTTVYLVDKRIDMVPDLLSSNLCSLRGNEERFAFSAIWEMDENAHILSTKFAKTIIKSSAALTYGAAQKLIDENQDDSVTQGLVGLNRLAKIMKKRRVTAGALTLASTEVRFSMDSETHDPIEVQAKQQYDTNSMVEEFMLQANISVANYIYNEFPNCALLRRHPEPPIANFEPLIKAGSSKGFKIEVDKNKTLADSLDKARIADNPYYNVMLRMVATRCMSQALYFSSGTEDKELFFHYGLAVPCYTHFTSPIRRFSDIIVHRMLAASIHADTTYGKLLETEHIQVVCNNLNYRHKNAQYAGRASVNLYTHIYFKDKPSEEQGYILFIKQNALQILIPKYGLEATYYLDKEPDVTFVYNEEEPSQTCGELTLRQFDPVTIRISIDQTNVQHQKVVLELLKPKIPSSEEPPPAKKMKRSH